MRDHRLLLPALEVSEEEESTISENPHTCRSQTQSWVGSGTPAHIVQGVFAVSQLLSRVLQGLLASVLAERSAQFIFFHLCISSTHTCGDHGEGSN